MNNLKIIYIVGVEGCGHHAMFPVIDTAVRNSQKNRVEVRSTIAGRWNPLRQLLAARWYQPGLNQQQKIMHDGKIQEFIKQISIQATNAGMLHYILEDNSFPSANWRKISQQWDIVELSRLMQPHADLYFIALYRDPIAMTFSHPDWDGGIRGHAVVVAKFLDYLSGKLQQLPENNYFAVHYEDLCNKDNNLAKCLANYLGLNEIDIVAGYSQVRPSSKDWRKQLPKEDQDWLISFFDEHRVSQWRAFLQKYY